MKFKERVRRLLLPIGLALFLAVPVRAECAHEFVPMRREPSCENDGLAWSECRICGYCIDFKPLAPLGHTFGEAYVHEGPTCTRDGVGISDCLVCGFQQTTSIPKLGHSYAPEIKNPTCTAGGYTRYNCRVCTSYYIADYRDPLGHQYDNGVLLKEPTETDRGRVRFTCLRCTDPHLVYYSFLDIASDGYYFSPVLWAVDRGITSGMDDTHFSPEALCNRAQVVTFLWRAAGRPEPASPENPFADVPAGSFYEKAVLWAYGSGITTGTDGAHFSPNAPCNRAQVVTFLHRAQGCPEPDGSAAFADVRVGSFYHKAVLWAAQRQITVGMDGGYFRPELPCSRAQIVTFLYRDKNNP